MRLLAFASIIWFVLMLCMFVFAPLLYDTLFIIFHFARWALIAVGFCLLLTTAVAAIKYKRCMGAFVLCLVGLAGYYTIGFDLGRHVLFQIRKPHYEQLLTQAQESGKVASHLGQTDLSSPGKHAFYWQRGILDNWVAVIHDPSQELAKINSEPKPPKLPLIFGGVYYRCQSMGDGWYICWFT